MPKTKKATILIVDDNPQNLQLLGSIIYEKGYNVSVSSSGLHALESISQQAPDLILLDIQMPEMDGFEVCKILKSNSITKDIPIIFLTAVTDSENIMYGFELGAVDYITKPFNKGELLARVGTHIELKLSKEKLTELNAAKDKFFAIIGHDLRNPAYALKMLLKQMTSKYSSYTNEEILYYLTGLYDSSENLYQLLEDLLLWSKSQWGGLVVHPEKLLLPDIIDKKIEQCKATAATKNIEIKSTVDNNYYVYADEMMLQTVIINLLSNAIKFSNKDGVIEIEAKTKNKLIEVSIKDDGLGMNETDLNKLFSIDSGVNLRGTNKEEVSGLGLILCKEFTERNGGTLFAKSEKNRGTTFSFTLKKELA
ncbi:MAG: hybrid sensor histidine kinase/response regulator [Paludibacter sp.]|nr:hybrid sensor histidine kinase/response regulator [Paludibacter sp.]